MEEGILSGKYAWRINNLSNTNTRASGLYSQVFTVGGCSWKILLKRRCNDGYIYMPIFLEVADAASLPDKWCRDTLFTFTLLHPCNGLCSSKKLSTRRTFRAGEISWGFGDLVPLIELRDHGKSYMMSDTITVEVKITLFEVVPPVELATQTSVLESYFSTFSENFTAATGTLPLLHESASDEKVSGLAFEARNSDCIEKAEDSLKECLCDQFNLSMRDELSSAISILSRAPAGLSPDFFCDFLTFEKYKSDLKFQTLIKDQMYCSMKRNHEAHLSYKQWLHDIAKEKEDLTRKLKELKSREAQLISNWESLMNRSKDMKLRCMAQEKKLAEAQKKKKIAEERMSRGTFAWSNLKEEFL
ncbi:hypothetical protein SAY87_009598 [Trapa incisa]|uniref:MATH domain-containing protein n=1 Tax=Trapa incisa TaxID=236973 RepID=A0AAN7JWS2_9MYRT|nr:hypothetical protein SAY87_009598 [Trapa incisa]